MAVPGFVERLASLQADFKPSLDKPEETAESTLRALWLAAAGRRVSASRALDEELPELAGTQEDQLSRLIAERRAGRPLAYITERQSFLGLEFVVGPGALIPRRETELLARTALDRLAGGAASSPPAVLDVGTGCGNLAIAMARNCPTARVTATDISPAAIALARRNTQNHELQSRVNLLVGDMFAPLGAVRFDLITCNPPYISSGNVARMPVEISDHEPTAAFDGGFGGFVFMRRLLAGASSFLAPRGWLIFEVGVGQGEILSNRLTDDGAYSRIEEVPDPDGIVRVIACRGRARRPKPQSGVERV